VFIGSNSSADFAIGNNLTYGVSSVRAGSSTRVVGSLLRTKVVDETSPIVYGVPDNLAMYSNSGDCCTVSATVGGGGRGGGPGASRATGRGTPDDPDVVQGRPALEGTNFPPVPVPPVVQPWQYSLPTDEQLKRNPANLIPPQFRPRVALRFDAQSTLLVSGLLDGAATSRSGRWWWTCRSGRATSSCSRTTRSTAARRSAATRWCSTRS
jgi:hypothetical protein